PTRAASARSSGSGQNSGVRIPGLRKGEHITAAEVRALIADKARAIDSGKNHFEIMDLSDNAKRDDIRLSYFQLAKPLHPDRLQALGIRDQVSEAQRVFAHINQAFAVLSHPARTAEYRRELQARAQAGEQADAEQLAAKLFAAEEHFRKGEMALRRSHFAEA